MMEKFRLFLRVSKREEEAGGTKVAFNRAYVGSTFTGLSQAINRAAICSSLIVLSMFCLLLLLSRGIYSEAD
jgi:hypothetical protein